MAQSSRVAGAGEANLRGLPKFLESLDIGYSGRQSIPVTDSGGGGGGGGERTCRRL